MAMTQADLAVAEAPAEAEELDPGLLVDFLGPRVRVLWNLLDARMVEALSPFGLRTGAFSALALISANPGCSQNQLAGGLGMDKSAVVAIIDELESRDLARRVRQAHDRRRHALSLTTKGKALLQRMLAPATQGGRPIREALSPREMEQLQSLLDRACRALAEAPPVRKSSGGNT
jgi:DNA-binding MarR family transcriptional regulator